MLHGWKRIFLVAVLVLALGLVLAACGGQTETPTAAPTEPPEPTAVVQPEPTEPPAPELNVPFEEAWASSPHNQEDAEAFVHWNEEDPAEVPANCAACHSTPGYVDFVADGTVDAGVPAPAGTVRCEACHDPAAVNLDTVSFLSTVTNEEGEEANVTVTGLDASARCMVCHQGRATMTQVDAQIARFEATDPDAVVAPIKDGDRDVAFGFINIHYYAAAITQYGTEVKGGYQYEGKMYDAKNDHVEGYASCVQCHDPHTTQVKVEECSVCHEGVASTDDLKNIREVSSLRDYDGDGDTEEGMFGELETLREKLMAEIQTYAKETAGTAIVYNEAAHPYFFVDTNEDGQAGEDETERYASWTPRLLKAAYNYQIATKDPGAYAHGNKYIVQLVYDSIEDLGGDVTGLAREDAGHFAGNTEAWRHWDAEGGVVPATCAKCHAADGMPMFVANGGTVAVTGSGSVLTTGVVAVPASNGLACTSCHNGEAFPELYAVTNVTFPSGKQATFSEADADGNLEPVDANLCLLCHQGRTSKLTVDRALGDRPDDTVDNTIRFQNVHYFVAGATLFGTEVQVAYEYDGQTYVGVHPHVENGMDCSSCHDVHALEIDFEESCAGCHGNAESLEEIRMSDTDWDGDGDTEEGMVGELDGFEEALWAAIETYAADAGTPIAKGAGYPYYFVDADGDGVGDVGERGPVAYNAFTPSLMKAVYNYQYSQKDPGAYAHNPQYTMQVLFDAIQDLGGDTAGLTRP